MPTTAGDGTDTVLFPPNLVNSIRDREAISSLSEIAIAHVARYTYSSWTLSRSEVPEKPLNAIPSFVLAKLAWLRLKHAFKQEKRYIAQNAAYCRHESLKSTKPYSSLRSSLPLSSASPHSAFHTVADQYYLYIWLTLSVVMYWTSRQSPSRTAIAEKGCDEFVIIKKVAALI